MNLFCAALQCNPNSAPDLDSVVELPEFRVKPSQATTP